MTMLSIYPNPDRTIDVTDGRHERTIHIAPSVNMQSVIDFIRTRTDNAEQLRDVQSDLDTVEAFAEHLYPA